MTIDGLLFGNAEVTDAAGESEERVAGVTEVTSGSVAAFQPVKRELETCGIILSEANEPVLVVAHSAAVMEKLA